VAARSPEKNAIQITLDLTYGPCIIARRSARIAHVS
jgi:hypothetical protein